MIQAYWYVTLKITAEILPVLWWWKKVVFCCNGLIVAFSWKAAEHTGPVVSHNIMLSESLLQWTSVTTTCFKLIKSLIIMPSELWSAFYLEYNNVIIVAIVCLQLFTTYFFKWGLFFLNMYKRNSKIANIIFFCVNF